MGDSCDRILRVTKSCNVAAGVIEPSGTETENYVLGGVLSNSKLSWISCGPRLTTLNNDDGSKRTGWTFGWALGDPSYKVTCVEELTIRASGSPILIVACESETAASALCFYHSGSSRVLKAIHFIDKITSLAVVTRHNSPEENISTLLKSWSGICAVGTGSGKVYLLDICWNGLQKCIEDYRQRLFDEQRQSKLLELSIQDVLDHGDCRTNNVRQGSSTLSLWLNEETLQQGESAAHPGVQNILGRMPRKFLSVSAVKYFPQIGTLAVGYNTSCFQLWDLTTLSILYTSALLEAMLPVYSFSLLEPSDDPKYVCYLWSMHHSVDEDNVPFAGMYILSFHEKYLNDFNMQTIYQGFSSCSIRYQLDFGVEIDNAVSGRIISCQAINRSSFKSSPAWLHTSEENVVEEGSTASLLAIAWEVWTPNQLGVFTKLTMFDLHQWYREYMPQSSDYGYARFMTHFTLPDGPLLDLKVLPSSIRQFVTLQPADEHFYPSAMTFDCLCLQQSSVLDCSHVGLQLECLQAIQDGGPSALLLPSRLYKMCSRSGIRPLLAEHSSPSAAHSREQREYVLSVALEFEMVQYLRNCVRDWCDGSHAVAGCTLPALLNWAWGRVERYKKWLDRMREPLFDNSGAALDTNDLGIFQHVICQLHRLYDLYKLVLEKYRNCILIGNYELQYNSISLVKVFYNAILWCVRNNVLPETNSANRNSNHIIPYLAEKIVNTTISRREELNHLAKSLKHTVPTGGLFLVDVVIAQEAGSRLTEQWEREGGQVTAGKYPPPSVQSLLRTYLVCGIAPNVKHFIVGYFLLDLLHAVDAHSVNEGTKRKLLEYPSDFGLSESQCKVVQAFWQLDHKEFEEGVNLLLDGSVDKDDLQLYHHRSVICLLVASGQHKLALHYLNIRNPGLVEKDDLKMHMTLLLVNDLVHEAFDFQKHHKPLRAELLEQFFKGCVEMKKVDVVFKLPLNIEEEEAFMAFLEKTSHPQADDLKVFYLLSRSRYVEAIDMNKKLGSSKVSNRKTEGLPLGYSSLGPRSRNLFGLRADSGVPAKTVLTTRDLIINSVAKSLPSVTRELADYCTKEKNFKWKQVNRPTPLSVILHTDINSERLPFYKVADSALVQAALSKTRETWAPLLATPAALKRKHCSTVEDTPFLRTPIQSRTSLPNEIKSGARWRTDDDDYNTKSVKKARLEFSPPTKKEANKTDNLTSLKTVDMELSSTEGLALLHTPYVTRVVKQKHSKETTTPHSILKGSAANTPNTPARSDKLLGSGVSRQIRFSLPLEGSSPSSPSVMNEDEEHYSPAVSPRKSIHQLSSVKDRKGTPANPRLLSQALRNAVIHLQFDDEKTKHVSPQVERSATATSLLEKMSTSPVTSNDTFFSFHSSLSSKDTEQRGGESFKLPLGLEGNIEIPIENQFLEHEYDESTLVEFEEQEISSDSEKSNENSSQVNVKSLNRSNIPSSPKNKYTCSNVEVLQDDANDCDQSIELNSSVGTKTVVIEYSTAPKTPITNKTVNDVPSPISEEESDDETTKKEIKWIVEQSGSLKKTLKLEVHKQGSQGYKKNVASITLSEEIKMYYSEPIKNNYDSITTEVVVNDQLLADEDNVSNENTPSFSLLKESEKSLFKKMPLACELVEAEKSPTMKSVRCALNKSKLLASKSSPSRSKEVQDSDKLLLKETLSESQLNQAELSFVNENLTIPVVKESNLPILNKSSKINEIEQSCGGETRITIEQTGHQFFNKPQNKSRDMQTTECNTKNDISSNASVAGPAKSEQGISSFEDTSAQLSENLVLNQDLHQQTNNAAETPLPHILDELLQKGRISLSQQKSQETSCEIEFCKDNTEESVESSLMFKQAFSSPASVALNSNQASVRWEFGASIVQEKTISTVEVLSQEETENVESVEENHTYSSKIQNESERSCQRFDNNTSIIETSKLLSKDVSSENGSISIAKEPISEGVTSPEIPAVECLTGDETTKDKQSTDFTFVIESTTSLAKTLQELENDPAADFDLKLSEGDSMIENNSQNIHTEIYTEEANMEPCYEILKPVQFQIGMDNIAADNDEIEYFDEGSYNEKDDNIYDDMIEQQEDFVSEKNKSEVYVEEVVCLSSSSDEEPENETPKSRKYSTPLSNLTPKLLKSSKLAEDTLDYEGYSENDSGNERSEDSETNDSDSKDASTESDFVESDIEVNQSHSVKSYVLNSSESEEDTHRRRSWKEQRKGGQSESLNSEEKLNPDEDSTNDTIESPCYELIEEGSPIKSVSTHQELETITEESGSINNGEGDFCSISSKPNQVTQHQQVNFSIETLTTKDQYKESCQKSSKITDIIKLAEDKRKQYVETGSILDLKKRRSKRCSSVESLTKSSRKLRRRSSSLHDFTSLMIKESKSVTSQYCTENEELYISDSTNNEPSCKSCFSDNLPSAVSEETDQQMEYEDNSETNQISSEKSTSLFVGVNSTGSTRFSSCADLSFMAENTLDYSKRRGKSTKSRFSSLQDISEETTDISSVDRNKSVRRSVSADNLMEHEQFQESHLRCLSSVSRWSDYAKAHESEITQSEVCENTGSQDENCSIHRTCKSSFTNNCDSSYINSKDENEYLKIQKDGSFSDEVVEHKNRIDSHYSTSSKTVMSKIDVQSVSSPIDKSSSNVSLSSYNFQDSNNINHTKTNIKRYHRAKSEPPVSDEPDKQRLPKKRRSSSLLKLQNIDKSVLSRYSLKQKSSKESLCGPLEVVYSDEECGDNWASIETQNIVDTKLISEAVSSKSTVQNESLVTSPNKNTELSDEDGFTSLSEVGQSSVETRKQRGKSEPPRALTDVAHKQSLRKSGSYKKIQNLHKLVFRHSLRKLNHAKSYQPLEIVHTSDEEKSFNNSSSDSLPSNSTVESENITNADNENHGQDAMFPKTSKKGRSVKKRENQAENRIDETVCTQATSYQESCVDNVVIKKTPKKSNLKKKKVENKQLVSKSINIQSSQTVVLADSKKSITNDNRGNTKKTMQNFESDNTLKSSIDNRTISPDVVQRPKIRGKKLKTSGNVEQSKQSTTTNDDRFEFKLQRSQRGKKVKKVPCMQASDKLDTQQTSKKVPKKRKASETTSDDKSLGLLNDEPGSSKASKIKIVSKKQKTNKVVPKGETLLHQEESSDSNEDQNNLTTPVSKSIKNVTPRKQKVKNVPSELTQPMLLDSPARRTRRRMSTLSDTELLTPTKEIGAPRRSARKSSAMSDIMVSTPTSTTYAESEMSEASTNASFRLNTPIRRTRKNSLNTPTTPDLVPEEYLLQRRLTRNQHSQLQKSFELSLTKSPRISKLKDLPEESAENEESSSLTPKRSSSRNANKALNYSSTKRTSSKTSKS